MTIETAIRRTDSLKHNTYTDAEKIAWLSKADWMIKRHIIDTHEGADAIPYGGYDDTTDMTTKLLAPEPYDEMYLAWLQAQMDLSNGEYEKYNASILTFNAEYEAFENYYNRNHLPLSGGPKRFLF